MRTKKHASKQALAALGFIFKLLIGLVLISPVLVGLLYSFAPNSLLYGFPTVSQVFENLTFENYRWVVNYLPIFRYLLNSLIVCAIIVCSTVLLSCMAGYVFAFFEFPGKKLLFNLILTVMIIPAEVTVICNYLQVQQMNLVNTYLGLSITSLVGGTAIFMMRQYFLQIPKEIKEASVIDGCGNFRFLLQIAIPMAKPAIASLAITGFIGAYNRYFWPMLISQTREMQTIQIGMAQLVGVENSEYGTILAGAMICIIVPAIVFIFAQKYIIKGMTDGAIKG